MEAGELGEETDTGVLSSVASWPIEDATWVVAENIAPVDELREMIERDCPI